MRSTNSPPLPLRASTTANPHVLTNTATVQPTGGDNMKMMKLFALCALLVTPIGSHADERLLPYINWLTENSALEYNGEPLPEVAGINYAILEIMAHGERAVAAAEKEGRELFPVHGVYDHFKKKILFPEDVDPWTDEDTMVHELVHYLQDINGTLDECAGNNEKEAYTLHWKWVEEHGYEAEEPNWLYVFMLAMACEEHHTYRHDSPP